MLHPGDRPGRLPEAEAFVTLAHAEAVERFLEEHGLAASEIDVIGFHGQTVIHRPDQRISIQIGDGQALAMATKTLRRSKQGCTNL